jgi:hypothetical protein
VEGKYDIHGTLNYLEICNELEWDKRYPYDGAWKNCISHIHNALLQEDAKNTRKKATAQVEVSNPMDYGALLFSVTHHHAHLFPRPLHTEEETTTQAPLIGYG